MDKSTINTIVSVATPLFSILTIIVSNVITYRISQANAKKADQKELIRILLIGFYYPLHKIWLEMGLNKTNNVKYENIEKYMNATQLHYNNLFMTIPDSIINRHLDLQDAISKGNTDHSIKIYRELIRQIEDQYSYTKNRLGYPSIGSIRQMRSWSTPKFYLFWGFCISAALGLIEWELMSIFHSYHMISILFTIVCFAIALICFFVFMKNEV